MIGSNKQIVRGQFNSVKTTINSLNRIVQYYQQELALKEHAIQTIVHEFYTQYQTIFGKYQQLEQINIKYIKNYLEIKKNMHIEDIAISSPFYGANIQEYLDSKVKSIHQIITTEASPEKQSAINLADNYHRITKDYLSTKIVDYEGKMKDMMSEGRRQLKQCKKLDEFKEMKERNTLMQSIAGKVKVLKDMNEKMCTDNFNEIFDLRREIESFIMKLNGSDEYISIEQSIEEQNYLSQLRQELITSCIYSNSIIQSIVNSQCNSISLFNQQLANSGLHPSHPLYPSYLLDPSNPLYQQLDPSHPLYQQLDPSNPSNPLYQQLDPSHPLYQQSLSKSSHLKKYDSKNRSFNESQSIDQQWNQRQGQENQQGYPKRLSKKQKGQKGPKKLDLILQNKMKKAFYFEEERKRDQLINMQNKSIKEAQTTIDKLITFIRRQFKDITADQIGDDPEKLIKYYLKQNQIKIENIQEEKNKFQNECVQLQQINTQCEQQIVDLKQEIIRLKKELLSKQRAEEIQKFIVSYQHFKSYTFEMHILTSETQDLVKLSIEMLLNTYIKKPTPEELILQLETIIIMIKDHIKKKQDIFQKLTINQSHQQESKQVDNYYLVSDGQIKYPPQEEQPIKMEQKNREYQPQTERIDEQPFIKYQPQAISHPLAEQSPQIPTNELPLSNAEQPHQQSIRSEQISSHQQSQVLQQVVFEVKQQQSVVRQSSQSEEKNLFKDINGLKEQLLGFMNEGFNESFVKGIIEKVELIKVKHINNEYKEMSELYAKYKQALNCLDRSQKLNSENEMKYQDFLQRLQSIGAYRNPQKLQKKLFYMESIIHQQKQLLANQRQEYEELMSNQIKDNQEISFNILNKLKMKKRESKMV